MASKAQEKEMHKYATFYGAFPSAFQVVEWKDLAQKDD
jgi:hypothetical protein